MNPTLDFYWVFLFAPLKTAKQFRSFRRKFFYCERSTKRSRIEEGISKSPPREVAPINWDFAVYTVISVKPCRGGVSPPAGRETRPLRGKTNKTSNSYLLNSAYHIIVILSAYTENETKPFLSDRQKRFRFGWGIGIRTPTNRVRVCRATVTLFPNVTRMWATDIYYTQLNEKVNIFMKIFSKNPDFF